MATPRSRSEHITAAKQKLESDEDVWFRLPRAWSEPQLIPPSLSWNGHQAVLAAGARSVTITSVEKSAQMKLALGASRNVVQIRASATVAS